MKYKKMIEEARQQGVATEQAMWRGVEMVDEMMEEMWQAHPEEARRWMRRMHESVYGCHYNERMAEEDIKRLWWTDRQGRRHEGGHWTKDEVRSVMMGKVFAAGVTDCDKWVAANVMWADLCKELDEAQVIEVAYLFFFADEDGEEGKIWKYMGI